jgi:hypothetical protein
MNYSQFKAMTAKELQERKAAKSGGFQTLDAGQAEYEARIARIIRERDELQAQREAERKPDEKRFC